jgi:hypothetical protein
MTQPAALLEPRDLVAGASGVLGGGGAGWLLGVTSSLTTGE